MTGASSNSRNEAVMFVYLAQWVREDHGVLMSDCGDLPSGALSSAVDAGLVIVDTWYKLTTYRTTTAGRDLARSMLQRRISVAEHSIRGALSMLPPRAQQYLIGEVITGHGAYDSERVRIVKVLEPRGALYTPNCYFKPDSGGTQGPHHFCLLKLPLVRAWRDTLFELLASTGLAVVATSYVGTRGGEERTRGWVLTPDLEDYLRGMVGGVAGPFEFPRELVNLHDAYHHFVPFDGKSIATVTSESPPWMKPVPQRLVSSAIRQLVSSGIIEPRGTGADYSVRREADLRTWAEAKFLRPLVEYLLHLDMPEFASSRARRRQSA